MSSPTENERPANNAPPSGTAGSLPEKPKQPSLAVGMVLLVLAGILIVVVLIQPTMPGWLRTAIAILAVLVVVALLGYAFVLWKSTQKAGRRR